MCRVRKSLTFDLRQKHLRQIAPRRCENFPLRWSLLVTKKGTPRRGPKSQPQWQSENPRARLEWLVFYSREPVLIPVRRVSKLLNGQTAIMVRLRHLETLDALKSRLFYCLGLFAQTTDQNISKYIYTYYMCTHITTSIYFYTYHTHVHILYIHFFRRNTVCLWDFESLSRPSAEPWDQKKQEHLPRVTYLHDIAWQQVGSSNLRWNEVWGK